MGKKSRSGSDKKFWSATCCAMKDRKRPPKVPLVIVPVLLFIFFIYFLLNPSHHSIFSLSMLIAQLFTITRPVYCRRRKFTTLKPSLLYLSLVERRGDTVSLRLVTVPALRPFWPPFPSSSSHMHGSGRSFLIHTYTEIYTEVDSVEN